MGTRMSVATISAPEFINVTSISPFASKCEIKVLYLGENRNHSFITKEVATEMAGTLPGCPIVGYYSENQEDFRDHGEQVIIDGDGVKFKSLTKPYGFVAPNTKIWFQDFEDTDEFGNTVVKTYLMTEGYLWTEQYKEAQKVLNEGRPQSMELDEKTLKGHWSTDNNRGIDFFIINDAIFSKLCILGEDVEPCFEGTAVTSPIVSSSFSKNDEFTKTLYSMMKELKELTFSLNEKGGNSMELQNENANTQAPEADTSKVEPSTENNENFSENKDNSNLENNNENQNNTEQFKKNEDEDKDDSKNNSEDDNDGSNEDENDDDDKKKVSKNSLENEEKTIEEKYALLETQFNELQNNFNNLQAANKELLEFKASVEDKKKDDLINSFYMLSEEDKADVIANKAKYTLEDIEAKLSIICVRKKVNFNLEENDKEKEKKEETPITYNLNNVEELNNLPAWLKAVEARRENV